MVSNQALSTALWSQRRAKGRKLFPLDALELPFRINASSEAPKFWAAFQKIPCSSKPCYHYFLSQLHPHSANRGWFLSLYHICSPQCPCLSPDFLLHKEGPNPAGPLLLHLQIASFSVSPYHWMCLGTGCLGISQILLWWRFGGHSSSIGQQAHLCLLLAHSLLQKLVVFSWWCSDSSQKQKEGSFSQCNFSSENFGSEQRVGVVMAAIPSALHSPEFPAIVAWCNQGNSTGCFFCLLGTTVKKSLVTVNNTGFSEARILLMWLTGG